MWHIKLFIVVLNFPVFICGCWIGAYRCLFTEYIKEHDVLNDFDFHTYALENNRTVSIVMVCSCRNYYFIWSINFCWVSYFYCLNFNLPGEYWLVIDVKLSHQNQNMRRSMILQKLDESTLNSYSTQTFLHNVSP